MSNRHQRRAEAAKARGKAVQKAAYYLATQTNESVTGATLILPDGEVRHLTVEEARAIAGTKPARGRA